LSCENDVASQLVVFSCFVRGAASSISAVAERCLAAGNSRIHVIAEYWLRRKSVLSMVVA
jgi:hypothetical protein